MLHLSSEKIIQAITGGREAHHELLRESMNELPGNHHVASRWSWEIRGWVGKGMCCLGKCDADTKGEEKSKCSDKESRGKKIKIKKRKQNKEIMKKVP